MTSLLSAHDTRLEATVLRRTDTPDGAGGFTSVFSSVGTVLFHIGYSRGDQEMEADAAQVSSDPIGLTDITSDVQRGDHLTIVRLGETLRFRVDGVFVPPVAEYKRVELEIIQEEDTP